ncbi:hypothetical protein ILUMI_08552 [Ignelater luminosus]|uniref:ZAD domain-containing protein n=1 Tax=Ignelater luminosus TaxID=2038154 RepID=A0A8K0D1G0_IGNLU|nr:hypothetical protein ILUMI_08552 [Ignelater luminosus]
MENIEDIMQLCRLCLIKDQANIPIFENIDNTRQILLKISTCLPVKVSQEDNLPKNICDECSRMLDVIHQFRNKAADSEKKLLQWLNQIDFDKLPNTFNNSLQQSHSININELDLKEENDIEIFETEVADFQDCGINEREAISSDATVAKETTVNTLKRKRSDPSIQSVSNENDITEVTEPKVIKVCINLTLFILSSFCLQFELLL